jgi:hypothetical protein
VAKARDDERSARERYLDALAIYERLGHTASVASALLHLAMATDDVDEAQRWLDNAHALATATGHARLISESQQLLDALAQVLSERAQSQQ